MNLPTKITLSRILLIPVFLVLFYVEFWGHYFFAAVIFTITACTDFVDGYLARHRNLVTSFGKFLDPIADKVLAVVAMIVMVDKGMFFAPFGAIFVSLIIARELIVSAFRMVAASNGIVLAADTIGKLKTIFTNIALPLVIFSYAFDATQMGAFYNWYFNFFNYVGQGVFVVAVVLTLISGYNYVSKNKHVFKEKDKGEKSD